MDAVTLALLKKRLETKASLVDGKVPADELPSYVDDVIEFEDLEHFPEIGEESKIYVALDTGYTYRWSGSMYVPIGMVLDGTSDEEIDALFSISDVKKGTILGLDLEGDGTIKNWRVLSVKDNIAMILAMYDLPTEMRETYNYYVTFSDGSSGHKYDGSDVDIYLNQTGYDTLTAEAKAAIVETDRIQDLGKTPKDAYPTYTTEKTATYPKSTDASISTGSKLGTAPIGKRKVFCIRFQDFLNYLNIAPGHAINGYDVYTMTENQGCTHYDPSTNGGTDFWLSTSVNDNYGSKFSSQLEESSYFLSASSLSTLHALRPACSIDLTKITYQIVDPNGAPLISKEISLNIDGTVKDYIVLDTDGHKAKLMAAEDITTLNYPDPPLIPFSGGTNAVPYKDSTFDTYLNETYGNTLTEEAKAAIIPTNIVENLGVPGDDTGSPVYQYRTSNGNTTSYSFHGETSEVGLRNIFVPTMEDAGRVLRAYYAGNSYETSYNVRTVFGPNVKSGTSVGSSKVLLMSAYPGHNNKLVYCMNPDNNGPIPTGDYANLNQFSIRPTFGIDLTNFKGEYTH